MSQNNYFFVDNSTRPTWSSASNVRFSHEKDFHELKMFDNFQKIVFRNLKFFIVIFCIMIFHFIQLCMLFCLNIKNCNQFTRFA